MAKQYRGELGPDYESYFPGSCDYDCPVSDNYLRIPGQLDRATSPVDGHAVFRLSRSDDRRLDSGPTRLWISASYFAGRTGVARLFALHLLLQCGLFWLTFAAL